MGKAPKWGVNNYVKRTKRKIQVRHDKRPNKGSRNKRYRGQGK